MNNKNKKNEIKMLFEKEISDFARPLTDLTKRNYNTTYTNKKTYYVLCLLSILMHMQKSVKTLQLLLKASKTLISYSERDANKIASKFKNNSYKWSSVRRTWIPKPGKNKLRPINTPTQKDRIIQEAIGCILKAIFGPEFQPFEKSKSNGFLATNYGLRPNRSCQMAVKTLKLKDIKLIFAKNKKKKSEGMLREGETPFVKQ